LLLVIFLTLTAIKTVVALLHSTSKTLHGSAHQRTLARLYEMDVIRDLLLRITEAERPLVYQSSLDRSLRNDDMVFMLNRQKRRLELQLVDTACREAINVVQRRHPSWSAYCLLLHPHASDVADAMRLVKLAEVTMLTPSVASYYSTLHARLPQHPTADPSAIALRLRVVWRNICVSGASAAVHFARPNKCRLALGYSQRAVALLRWVVLGIDGDVDGYSVTNSCADWIGESSIAALLSACFCEDSNREGGRHHRTASSVLRSGSAERIVGLLSSHSVILKSCEKFAEAAVVSLAASRAADALRDEVALRVSCIPTEAAADVSCVDAHSSATLLVALTLYNASSCMEAVGSEAASRSIACTAAIRKLCERSQQHRALKRCRELLLSCGEHGNDLLELVNVKLSDHYHVSRTDDRASPLARSSNRRVTDLLQWPREDANDTLQYFQAIAGRLSQEAQRYGRRRPIDVADRERWRPADLGATSLLSS
jgi:hypothetical protein